MPALAQMRQTTHRSGSGGLGRARVERETDPGVATLIRPAPRNQPAAVFALAIAVVETSFGTLLVPVIGRAALLTPRLVSTSLRAVALPAVASVCGFPAGSHTKPRSPAKTAGVSFLRLPPESLLPHAGRLCCVR